MAQNSQTMFGNENAGAGGANAFILDAFQDITDTPNTNFGFSSTALNNPLNNLYGNDDFPRYGPKTLWIKDVVLEPNRALWINAQPTYRIIWSEPFPSAAGYAFGQVQIVKMGDANMLYLRGIGDGLGVGGVFARCMFLCAPIIENQWLGSATAQVFVDGVANSTTIDLKSYNASILGPNSNGQLYQTPVWAAQVHSATNETYNIHDYRITAQQTGSLRVLGVVVYSENSTLSIDQFPGTTYNNKVQSKTTVNSTLALPSFGSSLGGRSVIWKNASAGYSMSTLGVSTVTSIAQGTNGTSVLNLTAGQGASFKSGYGIITASTSGSSAYVGVIQSVSTDALTVFPPLPFGISSAIYRYFTAGGSLALNASLNVFAYAFGGTELTKFGFTNSYFDPQMRYMVWGNNLAVTLSRTQTWDNYDLSSGAVPLSKENQTVLSFLGASGLLHGEGYFSAVDIEWMGLTLGTTLGITTILSGTFCVNGLPAFNFNNVGITSTYKSTVFMDAGPGWNNFQFYPGSSHSNIGIKRINMYRRQEDQSPSYGILAAFDTLQAFVPRASNATFIAPGAYRRVYADQLNFRDSLVNVTSQWTRITGATYPGGVAYAGASFPSLQFQYYGTHFNILGVAASLKITIDGASTGSVFNQVVQTATLGFHTIGITCLGPSTCISAIEYYRPTDEFTNKQTFAIPNQNKFNTPYLATPKQSSWGRDLDIGMSIIGLCLVAYSRRWGEEFWCKFYINGGVGGVTSNKQLILNLPANLFVDYNKVPQQAGLAEGFPVGSVDAVIGSGATIANNAANFPVQMKVVCNAPQPNQLFLSWTQRTTGGYVIAAGSDLGSSNGVWWGNFVIPVQGWGIDY